MQGTSRSAWTTLHKLSIVWWLAIPTVSLFLRAAIPPYVDYTLPHDDAWMIDKGTALIQGAWLGGWNYLTLAKPPGYPIFLAASHYLHIEPALATQAVYLIASFMIAYFFAKHRAQWLGILMFAALAFNPVMFGTEASRIYRDSLLAAQVTLTLGLAIWLGSRLAASRGRPVPALLALGLGASASWVYMTKADVLLYVAPAAVVGVVGARALAREIPVGREWLRPLIVTSALVIGLAGPVAIVMQLNNAHYGIRVIDDSSAGPIAVLLKAWPAIDPASTRAGVAVSPQQRAILYGASADAALLKPYLDPNEQEARRVLDPCSDFGICDDSLSQPRWAVGAWHYYSCVTNGICDDASTWFAWNLRDALALATDGSAEDYYGLAERVASDIATGCATGAFTCSQSSPVPTLPAPSSWRIPSGASLWPAVAAATLYLGADPHREPLPPPTPAAQRQVSALLPVAGDSPAQAARIALLPVTSSIVSMLRWLYAVSTMLLLLPAVLALAIAFRSKTRRWFAAMSLSQLAGVAINILVLAFLQENQLNYVAAMPKYALSTTPLLIAGLVLAMGVSVDVIQRRRTVQ